MTLTTRRPTWHLALLDDLEPSSGPPAAPSLLLVRPDKLHLISLGDFGARCPYGAACASVRARLSALRRGERPGSLHLHDARLARRLIRAVGRRGTTIRLRSGWPALERARAALPGGAERWRWPTSEERPAPTLRRVA